MSTIKDAFTKEKYKQNSLLYKGIAIGMVITLILCVATFAVTNNIATSKIITTAKTKEIFNILDKNFVGTYDTSKLQDAMYRGLVAGVNDRYTVYMDKKTYDGFKESTAGTYSGIGATVTCSKDDNKVQIVTPFPGSPSEKAGLKSGDKILKINGVEVQGDKIDESTNLMKGVAGTTVDITILQKSDGETKDVKIIRSKIDMPTVTHKMLENNTGYIRITQFDTITTDQYFAAYKDLQSQGMTKLVLDLRDNPGGLLNVVCKIANSIVPKGTIVYTEDKNGKKEYQYSDNTHIDIPLVVLVNGNSASASEVLTGAIRDYGVGTIVGTKTFGKGVVQSLFPMSDGSAVKVTIAKYYLPKGSCIHGIGITPDVVVPYDEEKNGSTFDLPYDKDIQLQKAFSIVNEKK